MNNDNLLFRSKMDIIFKISTHNPQVQQYFSTYVNLLNDIYAKANISAYFELIEGGLLWMLQSLDDLVRDSVVLDLDKSLELDDFFKVISGHIAKKLMID